MSEWSQICLWPFHVYGFKMVSECSGKLDHLNLKLIGTSRPAGLTSENLREDLRRTGLKPVGSTSCEARFPNTSAQKLQSSMDQTWSNLKVDIPTLFKHDSNTIHTKLYLSYFPPDWSRKRNPPSRMQSLHWQRRHLKVFSRTSDSPDGPKTSVRPWNDTWNALVLGLGKH